MRFKSLGLLLAGGLLAFSGSAAVVQAPWAPDVAGNTAERNLYQILGFLNNGAVNTAMLNSGTDFTVGIGDAAHYSSLLLEMAGNANNNEFGIYDLANTANRLSIFSGPSGPDLNPSGARQLQVVTAFGSTTISVVGGGSITIGAGTSFGFYVDTHTSYGTFFSEIGQNSDLMQHVAAYDVLSTLYGQSPFPTAGQAGYIMGWEDLPAYASDRDYQDMVVSLTVLPIPEPTTMLAGALLVLPFAASTVRILRRKQTA